MATAAAMAAMTLAVTTAAAAGPGESAPGEPAGDAASRETIRALVARVEARLTAASEARLPPLAPPVPIAVKWRARRISSLGLGGPLLAMAAGDIDGDERGELIALTTDEVVVLARRGRRTLAVIGRTPLPGELAAIQPRDPVGALVVADVDGDGTAEIAARSSTRARGVELAWQGGALSERRQLAGFPLCAGVSGELDPGRNYYDARSVQGLGGEVPERLFALRCRADLVDPAGRPLRVSAALGVDGTLALSSSVSCRSNDRACPDPSSATRTLADNGYAFALADVDRNGDVEVIVSAASAPGDGDRVTVLRWRAGKLRRVFHRTFSGGVVAIAAGDLDGDGAPTVIAAVRLPGSARFDLWTFN